MTSRNTENNVTVAGFPFGDASDDLANNRLQFIEFYHIPTSKSVQFKAFLTRFSDQYASDWNDEESFGRMDPISTFKRTKRVISLGWDVLSSGIEEAVLNLERCSLLLSMLYPDYEDLDGGASKMKTSPLFKLRFMNLIQNAANPGLNAKDGGLLGKMSGLTYDPDLEQGFFDSMNLADEAIKVKFALPQNHTGESIFPQTIKFQCEFTVIHEHSLGWKDKDPRNGFKQFPYTSPRVQFKAPSKDDKFAPNTNPLDVGLLPAIATLLKGTSYEDRKKQENANRILRG